jgi:hypothetical protein
VYEHTVNLNHAVLELDDAHPAKRFLRAFMECRANCSQRELGCDGEPPIEQTWVSQIDGKQWTFSGFIYAFICFDIELDGFLESAVCLTASEANAAKELPSLRSMMNECAHAARQTGNGEILALTDQVLDMLGLWEQYLSYRRQMIASA